MREEKDSFRYPSITEYKSSSSAKYAWILGGVIVLILVSVILFISF